MTKRELLTILQEELRRRVDKNPHYSLRSFARSLEVDASYLSKVFNGKRQISFAFARQICRKLEIDESFLADSEFSATYKFIQRDGPSQSLVRLSIDTSFLRDLMEKLSELKRDFPHWKIEVPHFPDTGQVLPTTDNK